MTATNVLIAVVVVARWLLRFGCCAVYGQVVDLCYPIAYDQNVLTSDFVLRSVSAGCPPPHANRVAVAATRRRCRRCLHFLRMGSVSFTITFAEAAQHAIEKYATLPFGPGIAGSLPKIRVVPPPHLTNFYGGVSLANGVQVIPPGTRQSAAVVLPMGHTAATQLLYKEYGPLALSPLLRSATDPQTGQLVPGVTGDEAVWLILENNPTERGKFLEWFMINHYVEWATGGAVKCLPTIASSKWDCFEEHNGAWYLGEIKTFQFFYHWRWSNDDRKYYLYITASLAFGSNPCAPIAAAAGRSLYRVTLVMWCRWRRRARTWRGPASSLGIVVPPGASHKSVDPMRLWIPTRSTGSFQWGITVGATNIGVFEHTALVASSNVGPQMPARYPTPPTPTYLSREHEGMAEAWVASILSGADGPFGAPITVAPFVEQPAIKFS